MTVVVVLGLIVAIAAVLGLSQLLARLPRRAVVALVALSAVTVIAGVVVPRPGGTRVGQGAAVVLVVLAVLVLLGGLVALLSSLPESPGKSRELNSWLQAHGVELTDANGSFLRSYVTEGHRLRLVCGIGGLVLPGPITAATGIDLGLPGLTWVMLGYVVGVVWGEAWLTRVPVDGERHASLTTRRLGDYLAGRLRVAQAVVPCIAVGLSAVATGLDLPSAGSNAPNLMWTAAPDEARHAAIVLGAAVPMLMGVIWLLQRHIVGKPQPLSAPDLVGADDAVRSSSVHLLSGAGLGVALTLVSIQLVSVGQLLSGSAATLVDIVAMVTFIAALVSWRYYGHRAWTVRRNDFGVAL